MLTSSLTYPMWFIANGSVWADVGGYSKMVCPSGGRPNYTEDTLRRETESIIDERLLKPEAEELARLIGMQDLNAATLRLLRYHRS